MTEGRLVDSQRLIALVHERRPLWDTQDSNYHNRDAARKLWAEIARELASTSDVVKTKWQNLRDTFRREHAKVSKRSSEVPDEGVLSTWRFYYRLLFLLDVFSKKIPTYNTTMLSEQTESEFTVKEECCELEEGDFANSYLEVNITTDETKEAECIKMEEPESSNGIAVKPLQAPATKRKSVRLDAINRLLCLEKRIERIEEMQDNKKTSEELEKEEDYHFLLSLLPYFRDIPKRRKLGVRTRIQQVLMQEGMTEAVRSPDST